VTATGTPAHGTATVAADGSLTYTPDTGWAGDDSFTYTITDAFGRTSTATVTVTTQLPAAPAAKDDTASTPYGTDAIVTVLGNDSGTGISVTSAVDPPHGSVVVNADGSLTYTPDAGWAGDDTFAYTITDAFGRTATASVTVTTNKPAAPAASDDVYSTPYQTKLTVAAPGVLGNDSGTGVSVTANTTPAHGTTSVSADGSLTYTPAAGWAGDDTFSYTITDAFGRTSTASVKVTTSKPAAPLAKDDVYSTPYQTALTVAAPGVLGNDSGTGVTVTANTPPGHGTTSVAADGSLTYTPAAGWAGADSFAYTITDAFGRTATASVTVTTNKPAAPAASNDGYSTPYQTKLTVAAPGVLGNDSGTGVTVTANTTPAHGAASVSADGSLTYTPAAVWAGADSFTYTITDAFGRTATASVKVTTAVPGAPVAVADTVSTPYGTKATFDAVANDSGTGISITSVGKAGHGTANLNSDGTLSYTPAAGWAGSDAFIYTITDAFGRTATTTVTVTTQLPAAPAAKDDTASTPYGTDAIVTVLGNDSGTGISVTSVVDPPHGSVVINADGTLTYTPDAGWAGDDTFTYTITDAFDRTATASVTATTAQPPAPFTGDDVYSTAYQTALTVAAPGLLGNDSGTGVTVTSNTTPGHGTASVQANGSLTYTPAAGWAGGDSFIYTIIDAFGRTATATVIVTTAVPGGPVAAADNEFTPYGTKITFDAIGNDSGTGISITSVGTAGHGTPTLNADGTISYTPAAGWVGADAFTYTITDAFGRTSTTTVTVTTQLPAAPAANKDVASTAFASSTAVDVLGNDSGTGISVTSVVDPPRGSVVVNVDGSLTYTPDAGWAGDDTFTYTITDAYGRTATASVAVITQLPPAPVADGDVASTPFGTDVTVAVRDNDTGTGITVTSAANPPHGSVTVNPDGSLTYPPDAGWAGSDTFTYTITDAFGRSATASVTVTTAVPGGPAAAADTVSTPYGTKTTFDAVANDAGTGVSITSVGKADHGTATLNPDGTLSYTPAAGWAGADSFTYTITDAFGRISTTTVTVGTSLPPAPTAGDDVASMSTGKRVSLTVLGNDRGSGITVTSVADPAHGTVVANVDGSLTYTPDDGWVGVDSFTYTITDAFGRSAVATVTVTTPAVAPAPTTTSSTTTSTTTTSTTTTPRVTTSTTTTSPTSTSRVTTARVTAQPGPQVSTPRTSGPAPRVGASPAQPEKASPHRRSLKSGALARTGVEIGSLVLFGVGAAALGIFLLVSSRRRRTATDA